MKNEWSTLLQEAVQKPGLVSDAYRNFRNYSIGNCIHVANEMFNRGLKITPVATYKRWQELGRQVKKGSKALSMCMPVTIKDKDDPEKKKSFFIWRKGWFCLDQTDGEVVPDFDNVEFDLATALKTLEIEEIPFESMGNAQGYAVDRKIAVSPMAFNREKTFFHEMAHVVLGHTEKLTMQDTGEIKKDIMELEAEATALICLECLGLPGAEHCRGYIQMWFNGESVPEKSAKAIFKAADTILKAGGKDD